jgi:hypothetical protein
VIATSGRAVEAAGDVDVLLLDKTGTITLGNRQASAFFPAPGVTEAQLADAVQLASIADETPEGRSIVVLAKQRFNMIGQSFSAPRYFWGRPSATAPMPANGEASGGSNFGPANPAQMEAVRQRIATLRAADPGNRAPLPVDLVTASASGLDPEISPAAAYYQALERGGADEDPR